MLDLNFINMEWNKREDEHKATLDNTIKFGNSSLVEMCVNFITSS